MNKLEDMQCFVRVVESNSFVTAARSLGLSQSRVSKIISRLEVRLGTKLLMRTTRSLSLTPAGAVFYEQARDILRSVENAEQTARSGQQLLSGRLRINAAAMLATDLVLPAVTAFQEIHKDVVVELTMEDRRIDPVAEGMDLIVRVGSLKDSTLIAKRAGRAPISVYAAPELLTTLKHPPQTIKELVDMPVIGWVEKFGAPSGKELILVSNALLARGAALKGVGFALLPDFLVAEDVATGRLERVLPYKDSKGAEIAFLHAFGLTPPLRVRTFMDFAVELWRKMGAVI